MKEDYPYERYPGDNQSLFIRESLRHGIDITKTNNSFTHW